MFKTEISYGKEAMHNIKVFQKYVKGNGQWPRSHVWTSWDHRKGLIIRNTHAKYESLVSYSKEVIGIVKVFKK